MIDHATPLLCVKGLTKKYGDNTVLDSCTLEIRPGEIHALVGGNGAGKSTLVRIISGLVQPSSGDMHLKGQSYRPNSKRDGEKAGIEIVQQEFNLIPTLSVAENLFLSNLPQRLGMIRWSTITDRARIALERVGLNSVDPKQMVSTLGVGQQQLVEIARALDRECNLLILDEPTAALSQAETDLLFEWLRKLRAQGVGIIYISHRLDEISRLTDRITFLRDGKTISTLDANSVTSDQMLELITGELATGKKKFEPTMQASGKDQSEPLFRVDNISGGFVKNCTFEVYPGEKVGITGLVGSGRTELLRMIFGADQAETGTISISRSSSGEPFPGEATSKEISSSEENSLKASCLNKRPAFTSPSQAVRAGLAMITEDRKSNGLFLSLSIRENLSLVSLRRRFSRAGWVKTNQEQSYAERMRAQLGIRSTCVEQPVGQLSGGNQQKVAIAKWLPTNTSVYLFDEPTRGIDVPARKRIYDLISELAQQGKGVVMVSSDIEELFENCNRILVMSNGSLVDDIPYEDFSHDRVMRASFAGYTDR